MTGATLDLVVDPQFRSPTRAYAAVAVPLAASLAFHAAVIAIIGFLEFLPKAHPEPEVEGSLAVDIIVDVPANETVVAENVDALSPDLADAAVPPSPPAQAMAPLSPSDALAPALAPPLPAAAAPPALAAAAPTAADASPIRPESLQPAAESPLAEAPVGPAALAAYEPPSPPEAQAAVPPANAPSTPAEEHAQPAAPPEAVAAVATQDDAPSPPAEASAQPAAPPVSAAPSAPEPVSTTVGAAISAAAPATPEAAPLDAAPAEDAAASLAPSAPMQAEPAAVALIGMESGAPSLPAAVPLEAAAAERQAETLGSAPPPPPESTSLARQQPTPVLASPESSPIGLVANADLARLAPVAELEASVEQANARLPALSGVSPPETVAAAQAEPPAAAAGPGEAAAQIAAVDAGNAQAGSIEPPISAGPVVAPPSAMVAAESAETENPPGPTSDALPTTAAAPPVASAPPVPVQHDEVSPTLAAASQEALVGARPPSSAPEQVAAAAPQALAGVASAESNTPATQSIGASAASSESEPDAAAAPVANGATEVAAVRPPRPDILAIDPEGDIDDAVRGYGCARIHAQYQLADGKIILSGHLRSEAERADLRRKLSTIPSVKQLEDTGLHIVGEPYCQVLAVLARPELTQSTEQRQGFAEFGDPTQSDVMHIAGGMPLEFSLKAPAYPSHVYLDYFTADGFVYHLIPAEKLSESKFAAGETVTVGGGRGPDMTIAPPYGLDVITAIGSPEPLFEELRPLRERASDYLTELGIALDRLERTASLPPLEYAYWLIFTTEPMTSTE